MTRMLVGIALLTGVYALVIASFDPMNLALGAAISTAFVLLVHRPGVDAPPPPAPSMYIRVAAFFPFAAAVALDIIQGTWRVALIVLGLRPVAPAQLVEVPIGDRTNRGVVVTSLVMTVSPGSVLVNVDWERHVMIFHVLGTEPDELLATLDVFYRRYQRWVFP